MAKATSRFSPPLIPLSIVVNLSYSFSFWFLFNFTFFSLKKGIINGVLYVPNLGTNLFSIAAATTAGIEVNFVRDQVTLSQKGKVVMVGHRA